MGLWKEGGETRYGNILCENIEFWNVEPNIAFFIELKRRKVSERLGEVSQRTMPKMNTLGAILFARRSPGWHALTVVMRTHCRRA